ncbi:MAG: ACT domain-containing protein [Peptococcaceae bacterium]
MSVKQISVFLENRTGGLVDFTQVLYENNIDIRAFSIAEAPDFGIARVIVDDFEKAKDTLKHAGYVISVTPVLAVAIPDRAGGLYEVLTHFDEAGVNVRYTYAFTGREKGMTNRVFCVTEEEKAVEVLNKYQIQVIHQEDLHCNDGTLCL